MTLPITSILPLPITSILPSTFLRKREWDNMNLRQVIDNVKEVMDWQNFFIANLEKGENQTLREIKLQDPGCQQTQKELNRAKSRLTILILQTNQLIHSRINPSSTVTEEVSIPNAKKMLLKLERYFTNAAANGDTAIVQAFISSDVVNISARSGYEQLYFWKIPRFVLPTTALMWAAYRGKVTVARMLMDAHADINARSSYRDHGMSDLYGFYIRLLAAAKELCGDDYSGGDYGRTALMWAAEGGNVEMVQSLINAGANVNLRDDDGYTALMYAAMNNHAAVVQELIDAGAKLDQRTYLGSTALLCAAAQKRRNVEAVRTITRAYVKRQPMTALSTIRQQLYSKTISKCIILFGLFIGSSLITLSFLGFIKGADYVDCTFSVLSVFALLIGIGIGISSCNIGRKRLIITNEVERIAAEELA